MKSEPSSDPQQVTGEKVSISPIDLGNGSDGIYVPRFLSADDSWKYLDYPDNHIPWIRPTIRVFGRPCLQVEVSGGRGKPSTIIDKDEGLENFGAARLRRLRPSFKENGGYVTAGNASSISDGAAALVLVSGKKALELGLNVIAKIKGYADAAQAPELFTTAPALAIPKAISHTGQIDYYEINEAFSVVALTNQNLLGLKPERVNVHGGAVSC